MGESWVKLQLLWHVSQRRLTPSKTFNPHRVAESLNWAVRSRIRSRDGCTWNLRRQFHHITDCLPPPGTRFTSSIVRYNPSILKGSCLREFCHSQIRVQRFCDSHVAVFNVWEIGTLFICLSEMTSLSTLENGLNTKRRAVSLSGWALISLSFQTLGQPEFSFLTSCPLKRKYRDHLLRYWNFASLCA